MKRINLIFMVTISFMLTGFREDIHKSRLMCFKDSRGHSFPHDTRLEAYRFIDKILKHKPVKQELESDSRSLITPGL